MLTEIESCQALRFNSGVSLYIFEEFNKQYGKEIVASLLLYAVASMATFVVSNFVFQDPRTSLKIALAVLLVSHSIRVWTLWNLIEINFDRSQKIVCFSMIVLAALLALYAWASAESSFHSGTVKAVWVPLLLASLISVHPDFLIAAGLRRMFQSDRGER